MVGTASAEHRDEEKLAGEFEHDHDGVRRLGRPRDRTLLRTDELVKPSGACSSGSVFFFVMSTKGASTPRSRLNVEEQALTRSRFGGNNKHQ
jgi:hypothetical protein